jgi:hypothetical protein
MALGDVRIIIAPYFYILCIDTATNLKPCFFGHEHKLWIRYSIVHILQQPVAKTNRAAKSGCFSSCTTVILYGRNLINFVAVKADPSETAVSCTKRLNDFRGLTCSHA